ncbi:peptidyl-prolyl cis-trans isomerase-like 4 [Purpureocillium lavendulum]|uniref:Peptidyl-prolyl cis-trans isomerase-like 4 n=1 Tax=Purpureocillium lavendulum TaxID=1247861 RepID=A0AB34FCB1_9HYPO|nr:peptidyl-prolyl cis-trans isomerase-like 4 [Purpureocillium lavendulum]
MTTRARRRLRRILEEDRAKCPFTVTALSAPFYEKQDRSTKKRKRVDLDHNREQLLQESLFAPKGKFKKHQSMDVAYDVEPRKGWLGMTRYNSFIYNGTKYYVNDYICVTNDTAVKRQNAAATDSEPRGPLRLTDYWVANILEIRGLDPEHVYARVFWMYSPDELPPNTLLDGNYVSGRQPYHGQHELIASNHMDIINVVSVAMPATVNQWLESEDEGEQGALYWRQAFNCLTSELSAVDLICRCRSPENPDKTLVGCSNPQCGQWLHYECLLDAFLTRVYHNLGTEKPHYSQEYPTKALSAASARVSPDSSKSTTPKGAEIQAPVVCQEIKGKSQDDLWSLPWTVDEQKRVDQLMRVVLQAIYELTPRASPLAKRRWTKDLTRSRRAYTFWRNQARTHRRAGLAWPNLERRGKRAAKEYHDAIRKQRVSNWVECLPEDVNIRKASKYLKPGKDIADDKVPPLRRADGSTTGGKPDQAEDLLATFFPPLPAWIEAEGDRPQRAPVSMPDMTLEEIEEMAIAAKPWEAPGEDGLPAIVWKQPWHVVKYRVRTVFDSAHHKILKVDLID